MAVSKDWRFLHKSYIMRSNYWALFYKYVHFPPSGIVPGGCFPRARPQPPRKKTTSCGVFGHVLFPQESPPSTHRTSEAVECGLVEHIILQLTVVNAIPAKEIHADSWGKRGIGETPQCDERNFHRVSFELRGAILHRDYLQRDEHPARGGSTAAPRKRSVFP